MADESDGGAAETYKSLVTMSDHLRNCLLRVGGHNSKDLVAALQLFENKDIKIESHRVGALHEAFETAHDEALNAVDSLYIERSVGRAITLSHQASFIGSFGLTVIGVDWRFARHLCVSFFLLVEPDHNGFVRGAAIHLVQSFPECEEGRRS